MQQNATLTPSQIIAVEALAHAASVKRAAVLAEVDRTTVHRWLSGNPAFKEALKQRSELVAGTVRARGSVAVHDCIDILMRLARNPKTAAAVRVQACSVVIGKFLPETSPDEPQDIELETVPTENGEESPVVSELG